MMAGGIAIVKLKATEDALSVKPVLRACKKKKRITSKSGIPLKPGKNMNLLFLIRKLTGPDTRNLLFSRVRKCMFI
jgi:hypothetical protein